MIYMMRMLKERQCFQMERMNNLQINNIDLGCLYTAYLQNCGCINNLKNHLNELIASEYFEEANQLADIIKKMEPLNEKLKLANCTNQKRVRQNNISKIFNRK